MQSKKMRISPKTGWHPTQLWRKKRQAPSVKCLQRSLKQDCCVRLQCAKRVKWQFSPIGSWTLLHSAIHRTDYSN